MIGFEGGGEKAATGGLNRAARRRMAAEAAASGPATGPAQRPDGGDGDVSDDGDDVPVPAAADAYGALLGFFRTSDSHDPENAEVGEWEGRRFRVGKEVGGKNANANTGNVKDGRSAAAVKKGVDSKRTSANVPRSSVADKSDVETAEYVEEEEEEFGADDVEVPDWYRQHFTRPLVEVKAMGGGDTSGNKWKDVGGDELRHLKTWAAGPNNEILNGPGRWQAASKGSSVPPAPPAPPLLSAYGVRERLVSRWRELHGATLGDIAGGATGKQSGDGARSRGKTAVPNESNSTSGVHATSACLPLRTGTDFVGGAQRSFFATLAAYKDVYLAGRPYPASAEAADPLMDALLLHTLNHCARAADAIKKNNDALKAMKAQAVKEGDTGCHVPPEAVPADQGFTRAKVLLLMPQRNMAFRVVSKLLKLAIRETRTDSIQGKQRFVDDFYAEDSDDEEGGGGRRKVEKPPEYKTLFAGNTDDHFLLGVKLTRGSVSLTVDFLQSDILIASPLGVVTRLEEDAAAGKKAAEEGRPLARDFLSSVELLVLERADVMLMQNWSHLSSVLAGLNQVPSEQHGTDIMRVREWALSGDGAAYRQTVILSGSMAPELNAFAARHCGSHAGALRWRPEPRGVLSSVVVQVQQLFERLPARPIEQAADARLDHFRRKVWPALQDGRRGGQLIFVSSYFDYVRLRNFLLKESSKQDFASLCEYTKRSDVSRGRSNFFHGRRRFLLYTERAHFYHRYYLRGVRDVLFYSLPTNANFYYEIVNFLDTSGGGAAEGAAGSSQQPHGSVSVLYDKYDALALERVVGAKRAAKLLKGASSTFMFC